MKTFKKVLAGILAATTLLSVSACGKTEEGGTASGGATTGGAAASGEEVTIKFSWWGGDSRHEATQAAVDAFMKKYPNIKVECQFGACICVIKPLD